MYEANRRQVTNESRRTEGVICVTIFFIHMWMQVKDLPLTVLDLPLRTRSTYAFRHETDSILTYKMITITCKTRWVYINLRVSC